MLKALFDPYSKHSVTKYLRKRRFHFFLELISTVPRPIKILDIGGLEKFWISMGTEHLNGIEITLLNLDPVQVVHPFMKSIVGDARDLSRFDSNQFDLVFSNSVIEHVGDYADQQRMAKEAMRVGRKYFIQTPNYFFPIEPHFLFPCFQFLPKGLRVFLHRHFALGHMKREKNKFKARKNIKHTSLLSEREFKELFPSAQMYKEKVFGLTKSFTVYAGF